MITDIWKLTAALFVTVNTTNSGGHSETQQQGGRVLHTTTETKEAGLHPLTMKDAHNIQLSLERILKM